MKTTIDMAREVGLTAPEGYQGTGWFWGHDNLKAFEALVRADEQEKYKWDVHSCGPTCKRYACVAMREAVQAERDACARVCESLPMQQEIDVRDECAAAIRARGNT
jgi:hypothetical protein